MNQDFKKKLFLIGIFLLILFININKNDVLNEKVQCDNFFDENTLKTSGSITVNRPAGGTIVNITKSSKLIIEWQTSYVHTSRLFLYKGQAIIKIWGDFYRCQNIYGSCSFKISVNLPKNLPPGNDYFIRVENAEYSLEYDNSGHFTIINDNYEIELDGNDLINFPPINTYIIYSIIGITFALHIIILSVIFLPRLTVVQNLITKLKERSRFGKKE